MSAVLPLRSGAFNDWSVAPSVMTRALTPLVPVSVTDSIAVPSGNLPNDSRLADAAFAACDDNIVNAVAAMIPDFVIARIPVPVLNRSTPLTRLVWLYSPTIYF